MAINKALCLLLVPLFLGCHAEVGGEDWCARVAEKPKVNWSEGEAADYTRHCVSEEE